MKGSAGTTGDASPGEQLALLGSALAVALAYHFVFALFHRFDWGEPVVKAACFQGVLVLLIVLTAGSRRVGYEPSRWVLATEFGLATAVVVWELFRGVSAFGTGLGVGMNDLGGTTAQAVSAVIHHENPYLKEIARIGFDPTRWGYKYGPGMLYGYALSGFVEQGLGIKVSNAVYLGGSVFLVGLIAAGPHASPGAPLKRLAPAAIACALLLLPERLYREIFEQGAVDMFPVMLLLGCIAAMERGHWFVAGLSLGLSFASKFSPAVFLAVALARPRIPLRLVLGGAVGLLPAVPFLFWDGAAVVRNAFLFHGAKGFDPTSLYNVVPVALHWFFPLVQGVVMLAVVLHAVLRKPSPRKLVLSFTVLLILIEVSYREIHGNHLVWFMPFIALLFAWYRHGLAVLPVRAEEAALSGVA